MIVVYVFLGLIVSVCIGGAFLAFLPSKTVGDLSKKMAESSSERKTKE